MELSIEHKRSGSKETYKLVLPPKELKEASRVTGAKIHGKGSDREHVDLTPKQTDTWIRFAYLILALPIILFIWSVSVLL